MKRVVGSRASAILYNVLKSNGVSGNVVIPANICESVPAVYILAGLNVVFCDISYPTWQPDCHKILKLLRENNISVLHYNRTYGAVLDEDDAFLSRVRRLYPELLIVDDRCLDFPEYGAYDQPVDVALFSTGPTKCINIGWGGIGLLAERLKYFEDQERPFSRENLEAFRTHIKYCHEYKQPIGYKMIHSKWLDFQYEPDHFFDKIEQEKNLVIKHKESINKIYSPLPGSLPKAYCNWRYQLLLENAQECFDELFRNGLYCSRHYMSLGNGYFADVHTPVADYLAEHILNLFNDFCYTEEQARNTADILMRIAVPAKI